MKLIVIVESGIEIVCPLGVKERAQMPEQNGDQKKLLLKKKNRINHFLNSLTIWYKY